MLEALKSLFENNAISEEIRADIQKAWDTQIAENKLNVTAELREEFHKSTNTIKLLWLRQSTKW